MLKYGFENSMNDLLREFSGGNQLKKVIRDRDKKNPYFERCLEFVDEDDIERVEFFENATKGRFPKHFKYDKSTNTVIYRNKKIKENIKLSPNIQDSTQTIINFFHDVVRHFSQKDIENNRKRSKKSQNDISIIEKWSDANQKQKDILIQHYIQTLVDKFKLDQEGYLSVKNSIYEGFLLNKIENSDLVMKEGELKNIKNLVFEDGVCKIKSNRTPSKKKVSPKVSDRFYLTGVRTFLDFGETGVNLEKKFKVNARLYLKINA